MGKNWEAGIDRAGLTPINKACYLDSRLPPKTMARDKIMQKIANSNLTFLRKE